MSIIPACRLSSSELARLGNSLGHVRCRRSGPRRIPHRHLINAVNRSLEGLGERVARLYRPLIPAS